MLWIAAAAGVVMILPGWLLAQPWPFTPPPVMSAPNNSMAQQNALRSVQSQVNWFQNSIRTASGYQTGAYGNVWQQFQILRGAYGAFTGTLTPQQLDRGANELAELNAGLDILQEAFTDYQQAVADGQSSASAFNNMCQVLYQASGVWLQELNSVSNRLHVGWR